MPPVKILLADDHKIVREGLRLLLEADSRYTVVAECGDGRELVQKARELSPDVIVVDVSMPILDGSSATRQINEEMPDVRIIALSMHDEKSHVYAMLKAGAMAYILKDAAIDELLIAIEHVLDGQTYLSPNISQAVVSDYIEQMRSDDDPVDNPLSPRELEVLQLLVDGKTAKEIAFMLRIGVKTIETHRRQLMAKLKITNLAELTKYAIRNKLTSI